MDSDSLLLSPNDGDSHLPLLVHIHVKKSDKKRSQEFWHRWIQKNAVRGDALQPPGRMPRSHSAS